jgi:hypothetical protein
VRRWPGTAVTTPLWCCSTIASEFHDGQLHEYSGHAKGTGAMMSKSDVRMLADCDGRALAQHHRVDQGPFVPFDVSNKRRSTPAHFIDCTKPSMNRRQTRVPVVA